MKTIYALSLEDTQENPYAISAFIPGTGISLSISFRWDDTTQEQSDLFDKYVSQLSQNDPLIKETYDREYDYVQYYLSLEDLDLDKWLDSNPVLPQSLIERERVIQKKKIKERISLCQNISALQLQYKESLQWSVKVEDTNGNTYTSVLRLGGWNLNQAENYAFRFVSDDKENIGKNDLQYVTFEVKV
nr:MAG TPA: hypothetical protein [Caudoviricetes sp.]